MKTLRSWQSVVDEPIKVHPVTNKTIEFIKKHPILFRGSVRKAMGKIWITSEFEAYKKRVLATPLP